MANRATALALDTVTKTYGRGPTTVMALAGISFEVPQGSFWSIMGPSGSGKSTLMHLLGLLDRPTSGRVTIMGIEVTAATNLSELALLRRRLIGFIFQQYFLLPRLTARENVMLPGLYAGYTPAHARDLAMTLLKRVGLAERDGHRPNELSGGEQQRVAIARALMNNPTIILADEPTGNLDSQTGQAILQLIETLHADGTTILLVTHDPAVGRRAQTTIRLHDGRLE